MRATILRWLTWSALLLPTGASAGPPIDIFAGQPEVEGDDIPVPPSKVIIETGEGQEIGLDGAITPGVSSGGGGGIRMKVPVRRQGTSMFVEVEIMGKKALMMVDTGASLTTLTPEFAKQLGILPDAKAPTLEFRTANGTTQSHLGMIKSLKLGSQQVRRVTFGLCPSCGGKLPGEALQVVGLLGMNVLGRFRMQVDTGATEIELESNLGTFNKAADLTPWLTLGLVPTARPPKKKESEKTTGFLTLEVKNSAPYGIRQLVLALQCVTDEGRVEFESSPVDVGSMKAKQISLKTSLKGACEEPNVEVTKGEWE